MKTCNNCNKCKSLVDFYINKLSKDGHANLCKECFKSIVNLNRRTLEGKIKRGV